MGSIPTGSAKFYSVRFESSAAHVRAEPIEEGLTIINNAVIAQLVVQCTCNAEAVGSSPTDGTKFNGCVRKQV